jgi:ligand-binding sensor domain-containing protein/putative methionine-R-sulfoxide reductase with GAF domain
MENGLTSDVVWSICKDKYNYVWMATQSGLNRYDGHHIKQYYHNAQDSFSIPGNVVYWIHKDIEGDLWLSFGSQGVAKYNYTKDRFERFQPFDSIRKHHNYVCRMWRMGNDQQGRIYFANGSSCFRYTLRTKKMEDLTPLFKGAIDGHSIGMFVPEGKDILWITTNNGLFRYDLVKNNIKHFPFDYKRLGFGDPNMHDAEFVNEHQLLVAVVRAGFVLFDTRTGIFSLPPAPIDPSYSKLFSETGGVLKDAKGRIWLANSRYGLLEYFPQKNSVYSMKNEHSYPYPYVEQEGSGLNVYEDDEGNIWYGSSGKGVIWFKPEMDYFQTFQRDFSKVHTLPDNYINYFLPIKNGKVLIATSRGLAAYNTKTSRFDIFPIAYNENDVNPHPSIRCMAMHGDSVFLSTGLGLSLYNIKTGKFLRFTDSRSAFDSTFTYGQWLVHYLKNKVLVTGYLPALFDLRTKQYQYAVSLQSDAFFKLIDINATMLDEAEGNLWAEAGHGELYSYNLPTRKLKRHYFTTDSVQTIDAIQKDEGGSIWLGTDNGLYRYDPISGQSEKVTLNLSSKAVYNIALQNGNFLWLSNSNEVVRYDRKKKRIDILSSHSFLPNSLISTRAFLLDSNGLLWIGTNKGFATIDTRRFQSRQVTSQPQLVNFTVFDTPKGFENPISEQDKIVLTYNENFFSFAFSSFNYHGIVEYKYQLVGFDKDWQSAHGNSGSYTNVPPGTYYLHIKSNSGAGGWVERDMPIHIEIKPPFWQTAWFYLLLALGTGSLLFSYYRYLKKRKRQNQIDDAIDYFANSVYGANSLVDICWDIARNCIAQLKFDDCVVYLMDMEKGVLIQKAAYGPKNPKGHEIHNPIEIPVGKGIVGTVAATAKPLLIGDTSKDNRYIVDDEIRYSELAVPVLHEGNVIGVIDSEHPKKNFFKPEHLKAISTIAAISSNKIAEAIAESQAKERDVQLLEIKKLLAESQLMSLRAQMNPHFVFNCLNSIQECIVTKKYGEASHYLNKFSKLFRMVLNNSGKNLVSLNEEREVLQLYLDLEHMRFEKSFEYIIDMDEELDGDEIMIPSMILQPYVENALWHGLMHKPDNRHLRIHFKYLSDEAFQSIIEDNGIGRKKSAELKAQQSKAKRHQSMGMQISADRIELLQRQGQHANLKIFDNSDSDGNASGTRVVVELSAFLS